MNNFGTREWKGWLHWWSHYYRPFFEMAISRLGGKLSDALVLKTGRGANGQSRLFSHLGVRPVATDHYHRFAMNNSNGTDIAGSQVEVEQLRSVNDSFVMVFSRSVLAVLTNKNRVTADKSTVISECH